MKIGYIRMMDIYNIYGGKSINRIQNHDRDVLFFIENKVPLYSNGLISERFQEA